MNGLVDVAGSVSYIPAWIFLKEHISRPQGFGIMLAPAAIALMTL